MRVALLTSALVLLSSAVAAQSPADSRPPIGARVRVLAPRLGPEWQIGMFNQLRTPASCHRILLFTPTGALRIRATLEPSELTRLQVAVRADGQVQYDHPPARGAPVSGERWREVPLVLLKASARTCQAHFDSIAPPSGDTGRSGACQLSPEIPYLLII